MSEVSDTKVVINGESCPAAVGELIMNVARRNGSHVGFVCDGKGYCSTCECKVMAGAELINGPTPSEIDWVHPDRLKEGYRLSCRMTIEKAGTIRVVSRAEILKRQFLTILNRPAIEGAGVEGAEEATEDFFTNLTTITAQHLERFPDAFANTLRRIGAVNFLFPWRDPVGWINDSNRTVIREVDRTTGPGAGPTIPPASPNVTPAAGPRVVPSTPFDFTPIEDIGPVFNQRFFEAGVYSYAELAALSPEEIAEKVDTTPDRVIRYQWREQAARFAAEGR